ncbi:unnamed protein product [Polarella glacialis]|uniref:Treble clef zinc finger domain-containing protein n=1 Tax=Polarella glacialis TaxID=89957 RepID=A0A813LQJ2_POLGL|nr:unnamed protein product [Polarella glacialis]
MSRSLTAQRAHGRPKLVLEVAQQLAASRDGICISTTYVDTRTPLTWQCHKGHTWLATLASLRYRLTWCPHCPTRVGVGRPPLGIEKARQVAAERGGQCLSSDYVSVHDKLLWQCHNGHSWSAPLSNLTYAGAWCPKCGGASRRTSQLLRARQHAMSKSGECLETQYVHSKEPMKWICGLGHEWSASLQSVTSAGSWCPECALMKNRLSLADASRLARSRQGSCLSLEYVDNKAPLWWRCQHGHVWSAPLRRIKNSRSWCPVCSLATHRLSLQDAQEVARQNGGQCLSDTYVNTKSPLRWVCQWGHNWEVPLNGVKYKNTWCPTCSKGRSEQSVRHIFESIFVGFQFVSCRPSFLRGSYGRPLELDGYCELLNLAFEYHGEQHYSPENYWNQKRPGSFQAQLERDQLKVSLCDAVGVRLVVVPAMVLCRWTFIRLFLLKWFPVCALFPIAIAT